MIRKMLIAAKTPFHQALPAPEAWADDCLQFVYDLGVSPVTFDFASYLAAAEVERKRRGLSGLVVVFVLGEGGSLRTEQGTLANIDEEGRFFRVRNLLIPMLALLPSVRGYALCRDRAQADSIVTRDEAHLYPSDYRVFQPRQPHKRVIHDLARAGTPIWPLFRAGKTASDFVSTFLARVCDGRAPVVITLRNSRHSPQRNSRVENWIRFADQLDPSKYAPVFVCDTEAAMDVVPPGLEKHIRCDAASWNIEVRMALFEQAWLNIAQMHGPMELCWYNQRARYLVFLETGTAPENAPDYLAENGHVVGADFDFAMPGQHVVWQPDDYDAIVFEFAAMASRLESSVSRNG